MLAQAEALRQALPAAGVLSVAAFLAAALPAPDLLPGLVARFVAVGLSVVMPSAGLSAAYIPLYEEYL